jgi:hypothetical protein
MSQAVSLQAVHTPKLPALLEAETVVSAAKQGSANTQASAKRQIHAVIFFTIKQPPIYNWLYFAGQAGRKQPVCLHQGSKSDTVQGEFIIGEFVFQQIIDKK